MFDARDPLLERPVVTEAEWEIGDLRRAIEHDGELAQVAHSVLQHLPARLRESDVERAISALPPEFFERRDSRAVVDQVRMVARSAYEARFAADSGLSARLLSPVADEERYGIEDARFVHFTADDGSTDYRATYTAYDRQAISSRSIVTRDFRAFSIRRLIGPAARTKGMAFFPRPVEGRLLALTRTDGESVTLAESRDGLEWDDVGVVYRPRQLWEVVQSGNCGSPIETDRGWLVLTHGVGPMRTYRIGAILLDRDDPSELRAVLDGPLVEPGPDDRDGYVPNVVYSCGGTVIDGTLWIPYGVADQRIRVASVDVEELLDAMTPEPTRGPFGPRG